MSQLTVRAYNVSFGDAILISIPERSGNREVTRHILIDVGNVLANSDDVLVAAVRDVAARTGGQVDLYVMTHEHLDHVQGLLAASRAGVSLAARYAWLTGSADPNYYQTHEDARKKRLATLATLDDAHRIARADDDAWLAMMVANNSLTHPVGGLGLTTGDYVDHLRTVAPSKRTFYVDRTTRLRGKHPFREARLTLLAPEEDTSSYYPRRPSLSLTAASVEDEPAIRGVRKREGLPMPPPGVDPGGFFDLVRSRRQGLRQRLLQIDKAANNTSVVLLLEWRGWRLLFLGDAELGSWQLMSSLGLLSPVHLVKLSHHGSHNGTEDSLLDAVLPPDSPDGRPRHALVSTHDGDWDSVPDLPTLEAYRTRCTLHDTRTVPPGEAVEITFEG